MGDKTPKEKQPFRMVIEAIFTIKNRGIVVIGKVEAGELRKNDPVLVIGHDKVFRTTVTGIEMIDPPAPRTDNAGLLLRNVQNEDIEVGMIVTTEGL